MSWPDVGQRPDDRRLLARVERQRAVGVLEQHHRAAGRRARGGPVGRLEEAGRVLRLRDVDVRVVEQPGAELDAQDAPHRVVDPLHRDLALVEQLLAVVADVGRDHLRVGAGVERQRAARPARPWRRRGRRGPRQASWLGLEAQVITEKPTSEGHRRDTRQARPEGPSAGAAAVSREGPRRTDRFHHRASGPASIRSCPTSMIARGGREHRRRDRGDGGGPGRCDRADQSGQVRRLVDTARAKGLEARLRQALERTPVASVGPVVTDELKAYGFKSDITPDNDAFFMRPLISAMAIRLAKSGPRARGTA